MKEASPASRPLVARRLALLPLLLLSLIAACGGGRSGDGLAGQEGERDPRPFLMGVSSLPPDPTEKAYRDAFRLARDAGDVVLIQRPPPWADFLPGSTISDRTERLTRLERDLARSNRLKLFLAVDVTDPADRGRLAAAPDDLSGADFSDGRVRAAFVAYAKYLALNYKPAYLALGVEVDMFFSRRGDAAFRNFQSLYFEAYDAVKEVSGATLVFPTFQYENMLGILQTGDQNRPAWSLVSRFEPKLDLLALSSFPGLVFSGVDGMPNDYYGMLKGRSQKPLIFASVGWSSAEQPGDTGGEGQGEQEAFLHRVLRDAESLPAQLFVWYLGRDPVITPTQRFEPLASMGLLSADGRPKNAWYTWRSYVVRTAP